MHYILVYCRPFYRERFGMHSIAEASREQVLSLPIFPSIEDRDVEEVIGLVKEAAA